jgi:hypothetical protein
MFEEIIKTLVKTIEIKIIEKGVDKLFSGGGGILNKLFSSVRDILTKKFDNNISISIIDNATNDYDIINKIAEHNIQKRMEAEREIRNLIKKQTNERRKKGNYLSRFEIIPKFKYMKYTERNLKQKVKIKKEKGGSIIHVEIPQYYL